MYQMFSSGDLALILLFFFLPLSPLSIFSSFTVFSIKREVIQGRKKRSSNWFSSPSLYVIFWCIILLREVAASEHHPTRFIFVKNLRQFAFETFAHLYLQSVSHSSGKISNSFICFLFCA